MEHKFVRNNTEKDRLINEIIDREWGMFRLVQNIGGRADCQDDPVTFYIMRYSQFNAFSAHTLESYKADLQQAERQKRNLITEKYAYMMEFTDPLYYRETLEGRLPETPPEKMAMIYTIADCLIACQQAFADEYPVFSSKVRPVEAQGVANARIYTIGELKTYTLETLRLYLQDILEAERQGNNIMYEIHKTTAGFYGYETLARAEERLRR